MAQVIEESFDQLIPGAASRGQQFLGVLKQRADAEGIGIDLQPAKPDRKEDRVVLRAIFTLGTSAWKGKGRPLCLEVYADPVGSSLQCGWQITKDVQTRQSITGFSDRLNSNLDMIDAKPEHIRKLNGILQAFQHTVFLPVLQQLADAAQRDQAAAQGQGGFFGN